MQDGKAGGRSLRWAPPERLWTYNQGKAVKYGWKDTQDQQSTPGETPRFGSGEGKATFHESIRGKDLFLLVDVCNHSITYTMNGYTNHMSPDDHYQDLKRVIAACNGKAHRINVIMPFLYFYLVIVYASAEFNQIIVDLPSHFAGGAQGNDF